MGNNLNPARDDPMQNRLRERLQQISGEEFEARIDRLAAAHRRGRVLTSTPLGSEVAILIGDLPKLKYLVRRAVAARDWFARWAPHQYGPLPISEDERENNFCSGDFRRHLVAQYSTSLQARDYDYLNHPLFFDYARGALAEDHAEMFGLAVDQEILREFPPKKLQGLDACGRWRPLPNRVSRILELQR
jgi:hypothetical protein